MVRLKKADRYQNKGEEGPFDDGQGPEAAISEQETAPMPLIESPQPPTSLLTQETRPTPVIKHSPVIEPPQESEVIPEQETRPMPMLSMPQNRVQDNGRPIGSHPTIDDLGQPVYGRARPYGSPVAAPAPKQAPIPPMLPSSPVAAPAPKQAPVLPMPPSSPVAAPAPEQAPVPPMPPSSPMPPSASVSAPPSPIPADEGPETAVGLVAIVLSRIREPKSEHWTHIWLREAPDEPTSILGRFPMLLVIDALGIVLITLASVYALRTSSDQQLFLWLGLFAIFAISFLRMLSPIATRVERMLIVCAMGLFVYLVPTILSPLHFIFSDEYLHWRTVSDIVRTGHLFSSNSMLPVSPVYPGLEIVTASLMSLTGLNTLVAGLMVVGVARLVVVLSLFLFFEQITKSARTAGIATMLYMSNSGFFMFDSLYLYEALGLAIGTLLLFALARMEKVKSGKPVLLLVSCLAIGALTTIHHVTDFFFVGVLILWTIVGILVNAWHGQGALKILKMPSVVVGFCGALFAALWVTFAAKPVIGYLSAPVKGSFTQLENILLGAHTARRLFVDHTGGHPTPLWAQVAMMLALGLTALGIPFAALCLWYQHRHKVLPLLLGIIALLYPFVQLLRVTSESANIPDRAAPFLFIGVSFALAILIVQMWPTRKLKWRQMILITALASVVFTGGSMLGAGPGWKLMPGSYLVGDNTARSFDAESVATAEWALAHLGPNNRMYTNSTNALLLNAYGQQRIITQPFDRVDIAPVYYAPEFHGWEVSILQAAHIRYLVVDLRLSSSLPARGYYFEGHTKPDIDITTPISMQALKKFDAIEGIKRIFDSGNIVIYDVGELVDGQKKS